MCVKGAIYLRKLQTDSELLAAALTQTRVTVREQDGTIADYGGSVDKITPDYIRIAGAYYSRSIYIFSTKGVR